MEVAVFISKYKAKNKLPLPADYARRVEACLAVQIHSTGARPAYDSKRGFIEPETFDKKYNALFETRLLNRHPNENPTHYNWRLSVYSPVAKEIFDKFTNLCIGSILQPNNYTITTDDNTTKYLEQYSIDTVIRDGLLFMLHNPHGFVTVIYGTGEVDETEQLRPFIHFVKCEDVIMYDGGAIAFLFGENIIYINDSIQATINRKTLVSIEYAHGFGYAPYFETKNNFTQPFQAWADLLVRNMNDDEVMTKQYSYPILQVVEQMCNTCQGQCTTSIYNEDTNQHVTSECSTCNGKGTISRNPGELYTISEEVLAKNGGNMYDVARYITPDVGIPEYHFKRWQEFYRKCEQSLHLKSQADQQQSGVAKQEDRKDQYFFLQSISNRLFDTITDALEMLSYYLNISNGKHIKGEVYITPPKQFDIMSDSDIVREFSALQSATDDSQTLSELNYVVNSKIYRDDKVQLKINEVLYLSDSLFGISGKALATKLLSGVYTDEDKIIHEKGYKILTNIAYEKGADAFVQMQTPALRTLLLAKVSELIPKGIYAN